MKKQSVIERLGDLRQTAAEGKIVALYIRVSSNEFTKDEEGSVVRRTSPELQTKAAVAYAQAHKWQYKIYDGDCDYSGTLEAEERPSMRQMIADIQAGKVHTVVFRAMDRAFRNLAEQVKFTDKICKPNGVNCIGLEDGTDLSTRGGQLAATIKGWIAQDNVVASATSSKGCKADKVAEGRLRTTPPYGYGIMEMDGYRRGYKKPNEADLIKEIFTRFADGEGAQKILQDMIDRKLKPKRGKTWHTANILRWIRNPIYKGICRYNGKEYKTPYEPIVTPELWERAQASVQAHCAKYNIDRRNAKNAHLLTGLLKCGYCSDRLQTATEESGQHIFTNYIVALGKTWRNGKRVNYQTYRCQTKYKHHARSCPKSISLKLSYLEQYFKDWIGAAIANDYVDTIRSGKSEAADLQRQIDAKLVDIEGFQKQIKKALAMFADNVLEDTELADIKRKANANVAKAETELEGLRQTLRATGGDEVEAAIKTLTDWDNIPMNVKKDALHKLIEKILVYEDNLVLYMRPNCIMDLPLVRADGGRVIDCHAAEKAWANITPYRFSQVPIADMKGVA